MHLHGSSYFRGACILYSRTARVRAGDAEGPFKAAHPAADPRCLRLARGYSPARALRRRAGRPIEPAEARRAVASLMQAAERQQVEARKSRLPQACPDDAHGIAARANLATAGELGLQQLPLIAAEPSPPPIAREPARAIRCTKNR